MICKSRLPPQRSPADRLPGDNSAAGRRARTAHALTEARRRRLFAQLSRPRSSFAIIGWAREGDGADRFAETEQSAPGSAGARMNAVGPFAATDRGALLNLAGGHSGGCAFAIGLSLFADRVLTIVTFAAAGSAPRKSNIPPLEGRARTVASRNSNYRDRSRRVCHPTVPRLLPPAKRKFMKKISTDLSLLQLIFLGTEIISWHFNMLPHLPISPRVQASN